MTKRRAVWGMSVFSLCVLLALSPVATAGQKESGVEGVKSVAVNTVAGDVSVRVAADRKVVVLWEKGAGAEPTVSIEGGRLLVSTHPGRDGNNQDWDLKISLPAHLPLQIKTVSGDLRVSDMKARVGLISVSGDQTVERCSGGLDAKSVSGEIEVSGSKGDLSAKTVSGDVEISDHRAALVEIKTVSGEIALSGEALLRVRTSATSGDVSIRGNLLPKGSIQAKSFSGNVELSLPAQASFELKAATRSGDLTVAHKLEGGERSETSISGHAGSGGPLIKLSSFSGNLKIRAISP